LIELWEPRARDKGAAQDGRKVIPYALGALPARASLCGVKSMQPFPDLHGRSGELGAAGFDLSLTGFDEFELGGSNPRSVPRNEPAHKAPTPSSPALGYYAKGLPAAVVLLRRNRTDRPLHEGFLLRRLHRDVRRSRRLHWASGLLRYRENDRPMPRCTRTTGRRTVDPPPPRSTLRLKHNSSILKSRGNTGRRCSLRRRDLYRPLDSSLKPEPGLSSVGRAPFRAPTRRPPQHVRHPGPG
jgi:hypothetical protein